MPRLRAFRFAFPVMLALLTALLLCVGPVQTAQPAKKEKERLVDQVRKAIERGILHLRDKQRGDGSWELESVIAKWQGGSTALVLLALMNSGVSPDDPAVRRGLDFLRGNHQDMTYVMGLETMVFTLAGKAIDRDRVQRNVDWLQAARTPHGWGYNDIHSTTDNSNSQYALLGLHEAILAGAKVDRKVLEEMRDYYLTSQNADGGWGYSDKMLGSTMTMTTACLCNLIITGLDVDIGKEKLDLGTGVAANCGVFEENPKIAKALKWLGDRMPDTLTEAQAARWGSPFYALYGIECAGRLTGHASSAAGTGIALAAIISSKSKMTTAHGATADWPPVDSTIGRWSPPAFRCCSCPKGEHPCCSRRWLMVLTTTGTANIAT